MPGIQRIGNVFYRAPDMEAAVNFYTRVLGFTMKFRDGDHWAAFDVAGMTLAVEGGAPAGSGGATVSLRVDGLAESGLRPPRQRRTRHRRRKRPPRAPCQRARPRGGNTLVLYEPA